MILKIAYLEEENKLLKIKLSEIEDKLNSLQK